MNPSCFSSSTRRWLLLIGLCLLLLSSVLAQSDPEFSTARGRENSVSIEAVTRAGGFHSPLDATPGPFGNFIYFIAVGPHGPGVFRVPAVADSPAIELAAGSPFVAPTGISISTDGQLIFIADAQAWSDDGGAGQIFVLSVRGGAPVPLRGAAGTRPRNLDLVSEGNEDVIYFSGEAPRLHQPAIFRIPSDGAKSPKIIAQGAPLVEPDGIAVTKSGVIYLTDHASAGNGRGNIFKIKGRSITPITLPVRLGNPAGISLTLDESSLMVSAIQRDGYDQVLVVNLQTLGIQHLTDVVGENYNDAGGLHRAHFRDIFAWAGIRAGLSGTGLVYQIGGNP